MKRSLPAMVSEYFLYFFIYSAVGAFVETAFRFVTEGQLYGIHGILHVPILPIYGFGALLIIWISRYVKKPIPLFVFATIFTSILEFISSWIYEMIFGTKLWDYSEKHFNFEGRVSLDNSLGFGVVALLLVYELHPFVKKWIEKIPSVAIIVLAASVLAVLGIDLTLSFISKLA
jgi:uncharacterized membrane protein